MPDVVPVERVGSRFVFRRQQPEARTRHEPEQRTLTRADRAVAGQHLAELTFHLVGHLAAVAVATVFHRRTPWRKANQARAYIARPPPRSTTALKHTRNLRRVMVQYRRRTAEIEEKAEARLEVERLPVHGEAPAVDPRQR